MLYSLKSGPIPIQLRSLSVWSKTVHQVERTQQLLKTVNHLESTQQLYSVLPNEVT